VSLSYRIVRLFWRLAIGLLTGGLLTVLLVRFAPGFGVDERMLDASLSEATRATIGNHADAPDVWRSYTNYLTRAMHGDLGISSSLNTPVIQLLAERAPVTAEAVAAGLGLAWIIAFPLAVITVVWRASSVPLLAANVVPLCLPVGLIAVYFFWAGLPASCVIAAGAGPKIFIYSSELLGATERRPHVLGAIARGVGPWRVFWMHRFAPIAPEMLALLGVSVTIALGTAIPAEALCDSPGLGQLAWKSAIARDTAPLLAMTWLMTGVAFLANSLGGAAATPGRAWRG
jgi:peptide/nickel transport system permease protein